MNCLSSAVNNGGDNQHDKIEVWTEASLGRENSECVCTTGDLRGFLVVGGAPLTGGHPGRYIRLMSTGEDEGEGGKDKGLEVFDGTQPLSYRTWKKRA